MRVLGQTPPAHLRPVAVTLLAHRAGEPVRPEERGPAQGDAQEDPAAGQAQQQVAVRDDRLVFGAGHLAQQAVEQGVGHRFVGGGEFGRRELGGGAPEGVGQGGHQRLRRVRWFSVGRRITT
ncbi:hypothetical protein, partial [Streptomyces sp. T21Q-yed]|uniref:hypothetical protein n=1 Tax=Streptomyces sp. T21Q-yed TaxID=3018441 RepID=UPI0023DF187B